MFDYGGDNNGTLRGHTCHVRAKNNYKYVLEFNATKVEEIDLKAIYLGKISSNKFEPENVLEYLNNFIYKESGYDSSKYDIKKNCCRTFVHTLAYELGVERRYLEIVKENSFCFSKDPKIASKIKIQTF